MMRPGLGFLNATCNLVLTICIYMLCLFTYVLFNGAFSWGSLRKYSLLFSLGFLSKSRSTICTSLRWEERTKQFGCDIFLVEQMAVERFSKGESYVLHKIRRGVACPRFKKKAVNEQSVSVKRLLI